MIQRHCLLVVGLALWLSAGLCAADDPFVGTWKINMDKTQVQGQKYEVKDLGNNKYDFKFGDDSQTIVADGADHPTKYGEVWALKADAPDKWTLTTKHSGKVTSVATWSLMDGGKQLKIEQKGTRPDGSSYTESMTYTRTDSGSGFVGNWDSSSFQSSSFTDWVIKPFGTDGLSFTSPADKEHLDLKFDGKDYPDHGPRVAPGSMSSAKRIDEHTIAMTDKLKGKVMDTQEMKLSEDGKTLTITIHNAGEEKPMVVTFEKK